MTAVELPLASGLWLWDWDGRDETLLDPHPPLLKADVSKWLAERNIGHTIAVGDDADNGDNILEITFENEADATAFKNAWVTN